MQVLINKFDGLGLVDYTASVQFGPEAVVSRVLNGPSSCRFVLFNRSGLAKPQVNARIVVQSRSGVFIFTGFVVEPPSGSARGVSYADGVEEQVISAFSDEALLDQAVWAAGTTVVGGTPTQNWGILGSVSGRNGLNVTLAAGTSGASRVALPGGSRWSMLAANLAGSTRSSYRALNGSITVSPVGAKTHTLTPNDPNVQFAAVSMKDLQWLANDLTVAGHGEPDAYITEIFEGDGLTSKFTLTEKPFRPATAQATKINDTFQGTSINAALWIVNDAGGHIGLTAGGLTCAGGSGRDSESTVVSVQTIELGGNVLLEANGVQVAPGSTGVLLGLYTGQILQGDCFAGFEVNSAQGNVTLAALINGAVSGNTFSPVSGHLYTLRLRISSPEVERVRQTYYYQGREGSSATGGTTVSSAGSLRLEIQDVTNGTLSQVTILYSGIIPTLPQACMVSPLASGSLVCSVKSVSCTQSFPAQVALGLAGSASTSLVIGNAAEGAACRIMSTGDLAFYPAAVPAAGVLLSVCYRGSKQAIARRIQSGTPASGLGKTTSWTGRVLHPAAWSSVDCENAAKALLGFASSGAAALKGSYSSRRVFADDDLWPGDGLLVWPQQDTEPAQVIVRSVLMEVVDADAEVINYRATFADDRAEALSIGLSEHVPTLPILPERPTQLDQALANLSSLTVMSLTSVNLTLSAGIQAPINGGFEVRRRDDTFGPGVDSDLVLRTGASTFSIPRSFAVEQFFIRMYDGSNPPFYSAQSAAVFTNVPM